MDPVNKDDRKARHCRGLRFLKSSRDAVKTDLEDAVMIFLFRSCESMNCPKRMYQANSRFTKRAGIFPMLYTIMFLKVRPPDIHK
jgi:hypothetical protein